MKDNVKRGELFGVRYKKMHGHTQIILIDTKTGEAEVVADKDNLVTLAVPNIFESNLGGSIPYANLDPLRDMFGGVMCFNEAIDTAALLPENDDENELIAHAGQTPHASASTKRGNPNGAGTHRTDQGEGWRMEWDFADNQGNGDINAVALCHKWGGDIALTPVAAEANETAIITVSNANVEFCHDTSTRPDADDYLAACIAYDDAEDIGWRVTSEGVVQKVRYNYKRNGLNYKVNEAVVIDEATVADFAACHYIFYSEGIIYGVKVDADGHGFTLYTYTISSGATANASYPGGSSVGLLAPSIVTTARAAARLGTIAKSGDYIYLYAAGLTNFYKVNLSTKEFTELTTHTGSGYSIGDGSHFWGQMSLNEGLVIGGNYIINGDDLYPATQLPNVCCTGNGLTNAGAAAYSFIPLVKKPAYLAWGFNKPNSSYTQTWKLGVAFPAVYLATIQNLENTIEKRNNKTMKIIYTLTEVEENEQDNGN